MVRERCREDKIETILDENKTKKYIKTFERDLRE
jgi:hypothetical protein